MHALSCTSPVHTHLQFHPDVSKDANAEHHFVSIAAAYEFLISMGSKKEGGGTNYSAANSAAFHDWCVCACVRACACVRV